MRLQYSFEQARVLALSAGLPWSASVGELLLAGKMQEVGGWPRPSGEMMDVEGVTLTSADLGLAASKF